MLEDSFSLHFRDDHGKDQRTTLDDIEKEFGLCPAQDPVLACVLSPTDVWRFQFSGQ